MENLPLIILGLVICFTAFCFYKMIELIIRWMAALDSRLMNVQAMTQRIEKYLLDK